MTTLVDSWQLVRTISIATPTRKVLPIALPHRFSSRIIRTEATVSEVPAHWRTAGYLNQVISVVPQDESASLLVPLNTRKIHPVPLLASSYQFIFTPVRWLPAGLRLRLWQYTGPEPDEGLLNELLLCK